jgi:hypothetical protein
MVAAANPNVPGASVWTQVNATTYTIYVMDASDLAHINDTRGAGPGKFATGVGRGAIYAYTNSASSDVPVKFQFDNGFLVFTAQATFGRPLNVVDSRVSGVDRTAPHMVQSMILLFVSILAIML